MTQFSANLGFLWTDRSLTDAIRAAKAAGFDAVECHWPYATPSAEIVSALTETGLPMLGLNTQRGDTTQGENGLSALPGRETDARAAITEAIHYAHAINAQNVHVMAGFANGPDAHRTFIDNLTFATSQAAPHGIGILIEPLNRNDAPGYFLQTTDQALAIIQEINTSNLKLMFDCYHVGRTEGDILTRFTALKDSIGHVQFAAVPDRGAPDHGELNYDAIFEHIIASGWTMPLGAEYKPSGDTDASLGWLRAIRS